MARTHGRRATEFRAEHKTRWKAQNAACAICGQQHIDYDAPANTPDALELDHRLPVITHPHLEFDPGNVQPTAHRCNRGKGDGPAVASIGETSEAW
ncbi:hypothetical protein [Rathayibacter sp. VKM Ac-2927]|jgi:5-methylcytosine-specific restriction endonuclease McrA|uniref:hypothetical protein n=1 Tax=Rathayibacter sp. VKM Ac-2927 TaxID=2929478 RepID=UPI001FB4B717|nr:hypothetical protein [Rathayibacter sp. VKM Ac-2927]MCJ1687774.1 hypothetical protein [Rathayibacter sp. VKM Ac-2927]